MSDAGDNSAAKEITSALRVNVNCFFCSVLRQKWEIDANAASRALSNGGARDSPDSGIALSSSLNISDAPPPAYD